MQIELRKKPDSFRKSNVCLFCKSWGVESPERCMLHKFEFVRQEATRVVCDDYKPYMEENDDET